MTQKEKLLLEFIQAYIRRHGVSPSYEVMARALGMKAKSNLHRYVVKLERDGLLVRRPKKFYGVRVVDRSVEEVVSL